MAKIKKIKLPNNNIYDVIDASAVHYDESQSLTDAQKSQVRTNINAASFIHSHDEYKRYIKSITLMASGWTGSGNIWSQVVSISGVDANSKIDLYPTPQQLVELQSYGIALVAVNENATVTVYSINNKPTSNYTIQALITEIEGESV